MYFWKKNLFKDHCFSSKKNRPKRIEGSYYFLYFLALFLINGCLGHAAHFNNQENHKQNSDEKPTVFAMIGDFGTASPAASMVAEMVKSWQPDAIVTLGDNNYDHPKNQTSQSALEALDKNIGALYASYINFNPNYQGVYKDNQQKHNPMQFLPIAGNHDWYTLNLQAYLDYFQLPGKQRYYQYDIGPVAFFALDSDKMEPDGNTSDSLQGQWLKEALAVSRAPWKLVLSHHAPFSSSRHGPTEAMQWPYKAWGASAVLSGHDHTYEHLEIDGLTYVVCGISGARLNKIYAPRNFGQTRHVYHDKDYGALKIIATAKSLKIQLFTVQEELIDDFTLVHR